MRTAAIAVLLTPVLATGWAMAASTPPSLLCVKQAQTDLKACQVLARQAGNECTANYFNAVPPCFGANAPCASECVTTRTSCQTGLKDSQTACSAACDQRSKTLVAACRKRPTNAVQTCSLSAKLKSLKCKQKCARAVAVPLQQCSLGFNSCLRGCAGQGG